MKNIFYVFLISMIPVVELRGAIPIGCGLGVGLWQNYVAAVIGNLLPVPFILFLIPAVFAFMRKYSIFPKLIDWLENKAQKGAKKVEKYTVFGLFLFVAIPLPGTGAWTGSLIASLFGMNKKWAFVSILLGVLAAGGIMTLASYGLVEAFSFFRK